MGAGIGIWQLLIVLVIFLMVFGTKKLKNLGSDLGGAISGFKKAMDEGKTEKPQDQLTDGDDKSTIDVKAEKVEDQK
jgi:sec-independent protein translocase protein TatA